MSLTVVAKNCNIDWHAAFAVDRGQVFIGRQGKHWDTSLQIGAVRPKF